MDLTQSSVGLVRCSWWRLCVIVTVQQVCVEEGELVPLDSLEIFRPLTVVDARPLDGCVLSIRYFLFVIFTTVRCFTQHPAIHYVQAWALS